MDKHCENCKHWCKVELDGTDGAFGDCRHMPPRISDSLLASQKLDDFDNFEHAVIWATVWPRTHKQGNCGMWTPKQEAQP